MAILSSKFGYMIAIMAVQPVYSVVAVYFKRFQVQDSK